MDKKELRLCRAIKRAGIRASKKEGHLLDREELLDVKVQVMPTWIRLIFGAGGIWCGFKAVKLCVAGLVGKGILIGAAALLLVCCAIWGIRKTCRTALESMDYSSSSDILSVALEGIGEAIGGLFSGL